MTCNTRPDLMQYHFFYVQPNTCKQNTLHFKHQINQPNIYPKAWKGKQVRQASNSAQNSSKSKNGQLYLT
ncbi:hypothetical protein Patl1_04880 [Pistacia atlantica]|uniref:Uncharacterized protein n=2 Tax=Pistacia atlantica TaxID=434234 RepID=A0ACC1BRW7_9ROSI|nr:hypothetical protein Patl1_04886 [Pistacia atlantica]KAJ0101839.1 hypothetical protein Patl1_04880 [Pistacia atlantica]